MKISKDYIIKIKILLLPRSFKITLLALRHSSDGRNATHETLAKIIKYIIWIHSNWRYDCDKTKHNKQYAGPVFIPWWRHQVETFSALLAICAGNSPVSGEFPTQRPVTRSFDIFFFFCVWINGWVNNREAGDLRRCRSHYDVSVMEISS